MFFKQVLRWMLRKKIIVLFVILIMVVFYLTLPKILFNKEVSVVIALPEPGN